jgi:hypothetical protein
MGRFRAVPFALIWSWCAGALVSASPRIGPEGEEVVFPSDFETGTPCNTWSLVEPSELCHLVISEVRSRGTGGASDEFVELYNPSQSPVTLDPAWSLEHRSNSAGSYSLRWTGSGQLIPARGHFLITGSLYSGTAPGDASLLTGISDSASLRLVQGANVADAFCYATSGAGADLFDGTFFCEGEPVVHAATDSDQSLARRPDGALGNGVDSADNASDFLVSTPANPQNTVSPPTP